jgi:DNA-binding response OmpR family regulator
LKILFADDGPNVMRLSGSLLDEPGLELEVVTDGRSFLKALSDTPKAFGLVVLGFDLPEINGSECISFVRNMFIRMPVLVLSGDLDEERLEELAQLGVRRKHVLDRSASSGEFGTWVLQALSELPGSARSGGGEGSRNGSID